MPGASVPAITQGDRVIGGVIEGQNGAGCFINVVDARHSEGQRRTTGRKGRRQVEQTRITRTDGGEPIQDIEGQIARQYRTIKGEVVPGEGVGALVGAIFVAVVVHVFQPNQATREGKVHVADDCDLFQRSGRAGINPVDINFILGNAQLEMIHVSRVDAGASGPLKKIAVISNMNLTLTRGLVWLEDVHYNGDKDGPDQGTHTFTWDNLAFDGPILPRDLAFDVLDRLTPVGPGYPALLTLG